MHLTGFITGSYALYKWALPFIGKGWALLGASYMIWVLQRNCLRFRIRCTSGVHIAEKKTILFKKCPYRKAFILTTFNMGVISVCVCVFFFLFWLKIRWQLTLTKRNYLFMGKKRSERQLPSGPPVPKTIYVKIYRVQKVS